MKQIFELHEGRCIDKWEHYFEIYDFWFQKYRGKEVHILEIGVFQGGSLQMWKKYFGENARIYGIDINPDCKQFEEENIKIFIGSQEDRNFLNDLKQKLPKVDILIDDGGHTMNQQIISFQELFDHVKSDGIYLCEDLHTSYWPNYGGGYRESKTFIEYSKNLIDHINAWNSREDNFRPTEVTKSTYGLHYYPSMLIIEKRLMQKPMSVTNGSYVLKIKDFPYPDFKLSLIKRIINRIKRSFRKPNYKLK
ncbi:class I SAM-dependent methyltransferase [Gramella jeungdoensis]|uniref:Class I SAM-dependent methyltransferase n=1 Tax=Gramella jeungdoensis TaxID=708091 RepID=A0ABT0Z0F0_9FLAO|nr:class I SAM-dependent methyltransferase [Gramella jeungdoensis]MCM8569196.1 class I SAM-dependent methyltransferase [Gramella jeungdoensis]